MEHDARLAQSTAQLAPVSAGKGSSLPKPDHDILSSFGDHRLLHLLVFDLCIEMCSQASVGGPLDGLNTTRY